MRKSNAPFFKVERSKEFIRHLTLAYRTLFQPVRFLFLFPFKDHMPVLGVGFYQVY